MRIKRAIAAAVSLHMLAWLAMLVVLAGVIFLAIGGYGLLVPAIGPGAAGLVVGAVLIGLVLLAGLVGWAVAAPRPRPAPPPRAPAADSEARLEAKLAPFIGRKARTWTRDHPGLAMLGALSAGVVVSASPALRRILYDAGRPIITRKTYQYLERLIDDD